MKTITLENKEYSCLDISFIGEDERGLWFRIDEVGHPLLGNVFGVSNLECKNGWDVNFDIFYTDDVNLSDIKPIVDDFVVVMLGEGHYEDTSTE